MHERYYTVKEAATEYFQGKVSAREVYGLFTRGELRGFRVGSRILIYLSSLESYRVAHENSILPAAEPPPAPATNGYEPANRGRNVTPPVRLNRLPEG